MDDSSKPSGKGSPEDAPPKNAPEPTIVGGRPLGSTRSLQGIPRGIEVLVKKASVDSGFREVLLDKRAEAAAEIGLQLSPAEVATLNSVPRAQIEQIIDNTTVPTEHRRVFLGKIGAAMLSVLALPLSGCFVTGIRPQGCRPDTLPVAPQGIRPDDPSVKEKTTYFPRERRVSYDLKRGTATLGRVQPRQEHLAVALIDNGTNPIIAKVHYECPFEHGAVKIIFLSDQGAPASKVKCRPEQGTALKGEGRATFSVEGKGATTTRILLELRSATEECKKDSSATLASFLGPPLLEPGEYMDKGSCVIWRIVEYRKEWPS
ncbi:MAG: hypothetical protein HY913_18670 [Desulfomonile tiedjei]|nr:hypothetical protein [Desulfomonile tiedjei]